MHLKAVISATSKEEEKNCDKLLEKNLLAGTLILDGDSRYHWKGEIVNENSPIRTNGLYRRTERESKTRTKGN